MTTYIEATAEQLTAAARDQDAFIAVYQMYAGRILRFCMARTGDAGLAEDIAQETCITMQRTLAGGTYTHTGAPFSSWLFTVALNHIRMHYRKHPARNQPVDIDGTAQQQAAAKTHTAEWMDVHTALAQLKERDRELLTLKYIDDLPNAEIARVLGISPNACGVKIHRALKRLHHYL